ncbi:MAG: hypothetical protein SAqBPW_13210 [Shewanella algae]
MNSNDIINPAPVSYRFYRVSAMTTAAILNRLPIDNRLKLTTDFSHVFKGPDGTLEVGSGGNESIREKSSISMDKKQPKLLKQYDRDSWLL